MLLKQEIVDALNTQAYREFSVSMQYLAMSLYFDGEALPVLAKYFHAQSEEEFGHGVKFLNYINDAGNDAVIPAVKQPVNEFKSVIECISMYLAHEIEVTGLINDLMDIAIEHDDYLTQEFLQWFIKEQMEEVSSAEKLSAVVKRADNAFQVEWYLQNK